MNDTKSSTNRDKSRENTEDKRAASEETRRSVDFSEERKNGSHHDERSHASEVFSGGDGRQLGT